MDVDEGKFGIWHKQLLIKYRAFAEIRLRIRQKRLRVALILGLKLISSFSSGLWVESTHKT